MQPRISRAVAVFLSIVIFLSSFAANPLNKSVTFLEARFVPGTGIVLLFEATGLKQSDLKGATILVHSNEYDLSCNFKDGNKKDETRTVRCVASGGLTEYAGEPFIAFLAGFGLGGIVPAEKIGEESSVCPEGEELWLWIVISYEGEYVIDFPIPAEFLSLLADDLHSEGFDYEVIDQACFPIEEGESPQPE